eukprot:gene7589-10338_t
MSKLSRALKRIEKEFIKFQEVSDNDGLLLEVIAPDTWHVKFVGANGTLYEGESFTLRIKFTEDYPMDSPQVVFLPPAPVHSHIYSNGHICLNILGDDWSPALTAKSICLSILSMLSSATVKTPPEDNDRYIFTHGTSSNPKNTHFAYHDDKV